MEHIVCGSHCLYDGVFCVNVPLQKAYSIRLTWNEHCLLMLYITWSHHSVPMDLLLRNVHIVEVKEAQVEFSSYDSSCSSLSPPRKLPLRVRDPLEGMGCDIGAVEGRGNRGHHSKVGDTFACAKDPLNPAMIFWRWSMSRFKITWN